jgi:hypothetical protein
MANITLKAPDRLPAGASVSAYPLSNFPQGMAVGAPVGSAAATVTADATTGAVLFTGLLEATAYVAYALVGSEHHYVHFQTDPASTDTELNTTALLRPYEVETLAVDLTANNSTLISGTVYGTLAICRTAGTYTKIGFLHNTVTPSLTELRAGVHNPSTGVRTTDTGDIKASLGAGTVGTIIESSLGSSVTLARGEAVFLSLGGSGVTMPSIRGGAVAFALLNKTVNAGYKRGRVATGYTTGVLPTLNADATTSVMPYLYLAP